MERTADWRRSSARRRHGGEPELDAGPVRRPAEELRSVNEPQTEAEVKRYRESLQHDRPKKKAGEPRVERAGEDKSSPLS